MKRAVNTVAALCSEIRFLAFADGVAALEIRLTIAVTSALLFMLMVTNPHPH